MAVDLTPTAGMAEAARTGLRLHNEGKSGDGLQPETVRRANIIAAREELTEDHVREMNAWFARHESDRRPDWNKPGEETPGFVAWMLWSGDAGQQWSARKVEQLDREDDRSNAMEGMIEKRDMPFEDEGELVIETRADGRPVIKGYAVVYNRLSVDLGGFRERIMPGAFDAVLNRQRGRGDLVSYYNHNPDILLGRESSGTLEVFSDEKGVGYIVTPPATRADIVELIQRRDVKGSSFTFSVDKGGEAFVTDETGRAIREVRAATIYELGPVVQPAYPSTTAAVAMRSFQAWLAEQVTPESMPHAVSGPDVFQASMRLRAARLRSFMRGQAR
jgi:HK97 family phage prohead protease